eukprot:scaffold36084_cov101-Isochrysis_galbana.AAC.2
MKLVQLGSRRKHAHLADAVDAEHPQVGKRPPLEPQQQRLQRRFGHADPLQVETEQRIAVVKAAAQAARVGVRRRPHPLEAELGHRAQVLAAQAAVQPAGCLAVGSYAEALNFGQQVKIVGPHRPAALHLQARVFGPGVALGAQAVVERRGQAAAEVD